MSRCVNYVMHNGGIIGDLGSFDFLQYFFFFFDIISSFLIKLKIHRYSDQNLHLYLVLFSFRIFILHITKLSKKGSEH